MTLDDNKIAEEKKSLEINVENAKAQLYRLMGMLDALNQLEKMKPEEEKPA
jgi:hypothetical protein